MQRLAFDKIEASGHRNVRGTHRTTFEVTREEELGRRGTCIIAVSASKAASHLDQELKRSLKQGARLRTAVRVGGLCDVIWGIGSTALSIESMSSMVFRKSDFIDDRTVCLNCDKSASDIDRRIISALKSPETKMSMELESFR